MMDQNNIIECGGFYFIHNFDSGNLGHVERVHTEHIAPSLNHKTNVPELPDYEFNMWTRPDCAGTEFENGNRTWFYFGIQASEPGILVRLNLINLNKQGKMYNQGMAPVTRTLPGKPQWERIKDRPVHSTDDNTFTLTFKYRTPENTKATTFFAFTYPFSFAELQIALNSIDLKMLPLPPPQTPDDIYYHRECLIYSLEGRRVDLLTISSHHGILEEREERLKNLFPDNQERAHKFQNKKVIFISARVHPGETPSSFVFNGFLNLLLSRCDPIAVQLRKLYVFKMIPFLNPDGVARGHYRTDTRGVNLNRVYLNPSLLYHPTVFASRSLIRYYHFGCEKEDNMDDVKSCMSRSIQNINESVELIDTKKKKSNHKSDGFKREPRDKAAKAAGNNKSSNTVKPASKSKESKGTEATALVDQVNDMKLVEQPSQTNDITPKASSAEDSSSLLNDSVLRTCLGSNVHISTSEELNLPGSNPLRPLRDTLKNSISLLMESSSSVGGDSCSPKDGRAAHVHIGWCRDCRDSMSRLEDSMPGVAALLPGYSDVNCSRMSRYHSIEEYRQVQRQHVDEQESKLKETQLNQAKEDDVYFCTNCFKRYVFADDAEVNLTKPLSSTSLVPSCGDSGDGKQISSAVDANRPPSPATKEEKPKSPPSSRAPRPKIAPAARVAPADEPDSGLYLYIDLHGHASKKGIFMYGNHFEDAESCVECMLLPRIMSLNNLHFHFSSCNFTERNMYLKDRRDGMSREGSGRVAVLKATGLVRSYTLECNYNTGRLVNVLPPPARPASPPPPPHALAPAPPPPPKYTPTIFQEAKHCRPKSLEVFEDMNALQVGRSLGASILDLTGQHPNSRIPCSEHRNLTSVRDWLRTHTRTVRPMLTMSRLRPKTSSPSRVPLYQRSKGKVTEERKENTYVGAKADLEHKRSPPLVSQRSGHDIVTNIKFKKTEPVKSTSRTRYFSENEPKPKTLSTKRRNILATRKPNASKTQVGVVKAKASRRSVEEPESPRASAKLNKRNFARSLQSSAQGSAQAPGSAAARAARRSRSRVLGSSSSSADGTWEEAAGGAAGGSKRRQFPHPSPAHLKKIRLKTGL